MSLWLKQDPKLIHALRTHPEALHFASEVCLCVACDCGYMAYVHNSINKIVFLIETLCEFKVLIMMMMMNMKATVFCIWVGT